MIDLTCVCNAYPTTLIAFSKMSDAVAQGEDIYLLKLHEKAVLRMVISFTPEQAIAIRDQLNALLPVAAQGHPLNISDARAAARDYRDFEGSIAPSLLAGEGGARHAEPGPHEELLEQRGKL